MKAEPASAPADLLGQPVTTLYGVGPERSALLGRLGISSVGDLLLHQPRRYEDRRNFRSIRDLPLKEPALTHGRVVALGVKWFRHHTQSVFELILDDGTARLYCHWWNLPYLEDHFAVGEEVVVFGRAQKLKPRTMDHPETEVVESGEDLSIHFNRITPVYPLTEGLPQRWLRSLMWRALGLAEGRIPDPHAELAAELSRLAWSPLPARPLSRAAAIRLLHFPDQLEETEAARRRLALDELLELQLRIRRRRAAFEAKARALPCGGDNRLMRPFLRALGFKLTEAQTRVLREIRRDLSGAHPMRRLLQGDVGCGKTLVAACAALMSLESGYAVAVMAPTEILAEQHARNFTRWFAPLGIPVELWTASHKPAAAAGAAPGPPGPPGLFVGTHALIEAGFSPPNLGLVIIDEQHKFGVVQREELVKKSRYPHLLVMTATPIPRTLGLTVYGELDISVIDELPPGRGRIRTFVRAADSLPKVWEFVISRLRQGRQAYVVYPRIEDAGAGETKAVLNEFERLRKALAPFRVGLLHGRLATAEKEATMAAFRSNQIQVLLATSLIEVGVDVPNATLLVVENAESFGLAQLHQLRGRIGRGAHESSCILVAAAKSPEARRRLRVLEESADGFHIAEADLQLRGPGEFLGRQQSGAAAFRFADLARDWELARQTRVLAARLPLAGDGPGPARRAGSENREN